MKHCPSCKQDLPLSSFSNNKRLKDGLARTCRKCRSEDNKRLYRKSERPKILQRACARKRRLVNRKWVYDYLLAHPCEYCGESDPACLEFDHIDPSTKEYNVSRMAHTSMELLLKEMAKCRILCANCHRKRTARDHKWYARYQIHSP